MVPKGLRAVAIVCATVGIVTLVGLVYVACKLLRRRALPLAPATSESNAPIGPTTSSLWLLGKKNKPREPLATNLATFDRALLRVTMRVILKATGNLRDAHVIGHGGFGTVYRATLPDRRRVAVKRLHGSYRFLCDRRFVAGVEAIAEVEHQNLVPLLGYCAPRGDERFLIYKLMHHGSLESWLRNNNEADPSRAIGWPDRLRICVGSARGLGFLHHGFVSHLTHGDMKSSNILLDEEMQPRVSDFGLARIISGYETHVRTSVSGELGYVPPEYSLAMKCTAKGDVYGFGVILLEVLTGRPAAGPEVGEGGGDLVGWVRWVVAHGREREVLDPRLPVSGLWREQMARVLDVARECTADEPWKRPTMGDVVEGLERIQMMRDEPDGDGLQGLEVQA
ncbi:unnamed protein product [Urochloa humidicola]